MSKVVRLSSNSRTSSSGSIQVPSRTSSSLSFSNERGRRARRRSTAASAGHFNRDPATLPRIRLSHHDLYDLDALADLNLPFLATLPEERKGQAQGQGRASGGRRQSTANASPSPSSQSAMAKRRRQRRVTEPAPFNITEVRDVKAGRKNQGTEKEGPGTVHGGGEGRRQGAETCQSGCTQRFVLLPRPAPKHEVICPTPCVPLCRCSLQSAIEFINGGWSVFACSALPWTKSHERQDAHRCTTVIERFSLCWSSGGATTHHSRPFLYARARPSCRKRRKPRSDKLTSLLVHACTHRQGIGRQTNGDRLMEIDNEPHTHTHTHTHARTHTHTHTHTLTHTRTHTRTHTHTHTHNSRV